MMTKQLKMAVLSLVLVSVMLLCACGSKPVQEQEIVQTQAKIGSSLSTLFFTYNINSAQRVEAYQEFRPAVEEALVLVNITVQNTTETDQVMYDSDFTLQYGAGAQDFAWVRDAMDDTMLPAEDTLAGGESRTYNLLYIVPATATDFSLTYTETYQDENSEKQTGETYRLSFTAQADEK